MRLRPVWFALAALLLAAPAFARTSVYISFGAPPPPVVVFRHEPRWELVPDSDVYEIVDYDQPGYDEFLCDGWYYIYNDGYWYRASTWRGPFYAIYEDYVPAPIWYVPTTYWRAYPRHATFERERWARAGFRGGEGWRGGGERWRGGTAWRGSGYRGDTRWPAGNSRPGIDSRSGESRWRGNPAPQPDVRWQGGERTRYVPRDNGGGGWRGPEAAPRVETGNGWPGRGNGGGRHAEGGDNGGGGRGGDHGGGNGNGNGRGHGGGGNGRGHGGGHGHGG